jgi:hypothetical protein
MAPAGGAYALVELLMRLPEIVCIDDKEGKNACRESKFAVSSP